MNRNTDIIDFLLEKNVSLAEQIAHYKGHDFCPDQVIDCWHFADWNPQYLFMHTRYVQLLPVAQEKQEIEKNIFAVYEKHSAFISKNGFRQLKTDPLFKPIIEKHRLFRELAGRGQLSSPRKM